MDIAVVYPRFDTLGGAEKFGAEVMRRWAKEHDVTLYALSVDEELLRELKLDVDYVECCTWVPGYKKNTLALMAAVNSMGKKLGDHDLFFLNLFPTHIIDKHPSIWYPHEPARMIYDLYPEFLKRGDMPVHRKLVIRAYAPIIRLLDKRLNHADKILANSRYCSHYLNRVYGFKSDVVYCGVNADAEPTAPSDYVLAVGRLAYEKRIDLAIKAMEYVDGLKLKIVGTGPYLNQLKAVSDDKIEFLGRVGEDDMRRLYGHALCTVYTPLREPFGRVVLDSMAAGTPVVGGVEGGYTEVVEDGVDGFLVEPTAENIAEKIRYLADNPDIYQRMSKSCIEKAGEYRWDKTASEILKYV